MSFNRQLGHAAHRLDDRQAIGQIRHEMAIHDVQMQAADPGRFEPGNLVGQVPKIAQQQRRNDRRRSGAQRRKSAKTH